MKSAIKGAAALIAVAFFAGQSAQAFPPSQATFRAGLSTNSEIADGRSNGSRSCELHAFSYRRISLNSNHHHVQMNWQDILSSLSTTCGSRQIPHFVILQSSSILATSMFRMAGTSGSGEPRQNVRLPTMYRFFEARESPQDAPLLIWLNGGPGCTSSMGLFFEMGPCTIADEGESTVPNHYSWNKHANLIFLDSPINTGFSYSSDGSKVDTLSDMTVDLYTFLTLFLTRYPEYASAPLHLAAESWGGHYAPKIGSYIHKKNKELAFAPRAGLQHINLASLIIVNGLTDPLVQFGSIPEYGCGGAPYPPWDPSASECATLNRKAPLCTSLIESCYRFPSKATCNPATNYCWYELLAVITSAPLLFSREGFSKCYPQPRIATLTTCELPVMLIARRVIPSPTGLNGS